MSETVSDVETIIAPSLVGVWVFDPIDPDDTERNYLHADGRSVSTVPESSVIEVAGRLNALVEFGESTVVGVNLTVLVPFGDEHTVGVQWWEDAAENRRAICYRDNRGRLYYCALPAGVAPQDTREGTRFALKLRRVDYTTTVA